MEILRSMMSSRRVIRTSLGLLLAVTGSAGVRAAAPPDLVARGEYLLHAGGCLSCHTAPGGAPLAGGRAIATPFGTFYTPNITPDRETGIGKWSDADFLRALRKGAPGRLELLPGVPLSELHRNQRSGCTGD